MLMMVYLHSHREVRSSCVIQKVLSISFYLSAEKVVVVV